MKKYTEYNKEIKHKFKQAMSQKSNTSTILNRKKYLNIFLGYLLGEQYFPNKLLKLTNEQYNSYCNNIIDTLDLSYEENIFLHKMINIEESDNFINKCFKIYNTIDCIEYCRLSSIIILFLETSSNIIIIDYDLEELLIEPNYEKRI